MRTLRPGSTGQEVARLQALLCVSGFPAGPIDGRFGFATEQAVRACQESQGLPTTGEAEQTVQRTLGMDKIDATRVPVPVIDRVTPDIVAAMFPSATPRSNIEKHLPRVLSAPKQANLDDRDLVLMAIATLRAETEAFEPIANKSRRSTRIPAVIPSTDTIIGSATGEGPRANGTKDVASSNSPGEPTTTVQRAHGPWFASGRSARTRQRSKHRREEPGEIHQRSTRPRQIRDSGQGPENGAKAGQRRFAWMRAICQSV